LHPRRPHWPFSRTSGWHAIPANCPHDDYRPKGLKRDVEERRARYYTLVVTIACRAGVPTNLFDALITQESGYNPYARSIKGAIGMSQLMPATARSAGIANPWDIEENLRGGAQILKAHLAEFGRYDLALAAYNAGAGRVRQTRRVPRIRETLAYVSSILSDVRRQYARAIGLSDDPAVSPAPVRTASLVRF
jgi:soluble lytic murein transglycosylase-like protein